MEQAAGSVLRSRGCQRVWRCHTAKIVPRLRHPVNHQEGTVLLHLPKAPEEYPSTVDAIRSN